MVAVGMLYYLLVTSSWEQDFGAEFGWKLIPKIWLSKFTFLEILDFTIFLSHFAWYPDSHYL